MIQSDMVNEESPKSVCRRVGAVLATGWELGGHRTAPLQNQVALKMNGTVASCQFVQSDVANQLSEVSGPAR